MTENLAVTESKNFKFNDLKVYSSTEWLADNKKKYRQVFDRYDTSYVYAELSFFNKRYDVEDWEVFVELKCFSLKKTKKELCVLTFNRKVSKFDSNVFIREGWGNKAEGAFWKKGTYYWEAWIEGEKAATKYFYVEDGGRKITYLDNPYVEVQSLKLYEGPYDDVIEGERVYGNAFSSEESRYIYLEVVLKNSLIAKAWQCELAIKFFNNARELKGQVIRLQRVETKNDVIKLSAGWGSNVKGSWRKERYTAELVFMDHLLAVVGFEVSDAFVEGTVPIYLAGQSTPSLFESSDDFRTFEEVLAGLKKMIGLRSIKQQVEDHAKYIQFLQLRKDKGYTERESVSVHSVFIGNPGTGKTTVAKMMGQLYRKMGLLTKGHVHEVDRVDLVGEYIGQTAPKVKEAIEKARGGVLFIDEAYALARSEDDSKDFGREVIEILLKELSNGKGDLAVIVAGYPKEMKHFLDSNPGLKSRFKHFFEFEDYLPQELVQIADYAASAKDVTLTPLARIGLEEIVIDSFRNRDRTFGNARFVYDLIEKAKVNLGLRVMASENPKELETKILGIVEEVDVKKIKWRQPLQLPHIPVDETALQLALLELNELVGLRTVKNQIHEMVRLVRYYRESQKDVLNAFSLHTVFVGNAGTGKTTVARVLTRIYKALGVLERGHMVETDRQGLVAGYVGQTATKTAEKMDEAKGGVLFIDEAYALSNRGTASHGDFGSEALETILKRMEDMRGQFFLFVAGYPDNMEQFLKANPGLQSRFDKTLKFEDYEPNELYQIAVDMLNKEKLEASPEALEQLSQYLSHVYELRDKYFGNARTVRAIVTDLLKHQNLRLAAMPMKERKLINPNELTIEDVSKLSDTTNQFQFNKKGIGFRKPSGNN